MVLRRRCGTKYAIAIVVSTLVFCEWIVYMVQPLYWHKFDCRNNDSSCTKILFIADPQIQGDNAVAPPLNYLFNWDSDRYLRQTFKPVFDHFKPDMLVYLGDLMDEGSIATMQQFHTYVKRLLHIFDTPQPVTQIWVPGDNDIGGENEPIKAEKVTEFAKVFNQPDVIVFRNISIYKVNKITNTLPVVPENLSIHDNVKIAVSHYSVMLTNQFAEQVINAFRPNIFFCAHEHESKYMRVEKDLSHRTVQRINDDTLWLRFADDVYYEIYVPTCSYRMGTDRIGYGAAIIEDNEVMQYTVFWSPRRFPALYTYLFILCLLCAWFALVLIVRLCYKFLNQQHGPQYSPLPLLKGYV